MLPEDQLRHWQAFYDAARHGEQLEERTRVLVHLAAALTAGCDP